MALLLAKSEIKSDFNSNIRLRNSGWLADRRRFRDDEHRNRQICFAYFDAMGVGGALVGFEVRPRWMGRMPRHRHRHTWPLDIAGKVPIRRLPVVEGFDLEARCLKIKTALTAMAG